MDFNGLGLYSCFCKSCCLSVCWVPRPEWYFDHGVGCAKTWGPVAYLVCSRRVYRVRSCRLTKKGRPSLLQFKVFPHNPQFQNTSLLPLSAAFLPFLLCATHSCPLLLALDSETLALWNLIHPGIANLPTQTALGSTTQLGADTDSW